MVSWEYIFVYIYIVFVFIILDVAKVGYPSVES